MADINSFMSTFYGATHEYVHQLDPFSTFTVTMKFFPCKKGEAAQPSFLDRLANGAAAAASNLLNNATGGLAQAIGAQSSETSVLKQHDDFYGSSSKTSFVDYLASAMKLDSGEQGAGDSFGSSSRMSGSPSGMPQLNLTEFVQDITVPFLSQQQGEESQSIVGKFPNNGSILIPDNNEVMLTVLNTKLPIAEYLFYPWMREVTLPYWSYDSQPYTTATMTVDFSKHADVQYVFSGCRPKTIQTLQPNNVVDGSALKRQITLLFDFMFISSHKMEIQPSAASLVGNAGAELLGGAAEMFNIT